MNKLDKKVDEGETFELDEQNLQELYKQVEVNGESTDR